MRRKLTTPEFISRANEKHSHKYDYSKSIYISSHDKVEIVCPIHGSFYQTANDHLNGCGCPICHKSPTKTTLDTFLKKCKVIHGETYDYSKVEYKTTSEKVLIKCQKHGEFWQVPYVHLRGAGCVKCRFLKKDCSRIKSTEQFIHEAKEIHGNAYDYSTTEYKTAKEKVTIICLKHGSFKQAPFNHLTSKQGCPKCRSSLGERSIRKWLKNNNVIYTEQKKFDGCRNPKTNYPLKYDFYLPETKTLIEYDGKQHFVVSYFGTHHKTRKDLIETQYRDKIKTEYAEKNGFRLIRIPFHDFLGIDKILKEKI